jgi:hypothetical protein
MSEYQYYEFQAIDRPLTEREMGELRSFSSRATITPTRFVNHYEWGSFKGNSSAWMEKYFDAFLYLANWGTHELMLRLPRRVLDASMVKQYCCGESASAREKGDVEVPRRVLILVLRLPVRLEKWRLDLQRCQVPLFEELIELHRFSSFWCGGVRERPTQESTLDRREGKPTINRCSSFGYSPRSPMLGGRHSFHPRGRPIEYRVRAEGRVKSPVATVRFAPNG